MPSKLQPSFNEPNIIDMKRLLLSFLFLAFFQQLIKANDFFASRDYFELRVYHITSKDQETVIDNYLKNALIPALQSVYLNRLQTIQPLTKKFMC
jgi:hypothetical protein